MAKTKKTQGKLARYVNTPEAMERFRRHYGIPDDVYLEYRFWEDAITGEHGDLIIPLAAIIEGGVRFPIDLLLADFLDYFRISPTQISPNIFRIVNGVAELNRRLGFNLTVHDIIATYFLRTTQHEAFSLRPRDVNNTLGTGISLVTGVPPQTGNQVRFCWTVEFHMRRKRSKSRPTSLILLPSKPSTIVRSAWTNTQIPAQPTSFSGTFRLHRSFLQCRQVRNLAEALANPANKSPPVHDIRDMVGINLKKLLPPTRPQAETSEPVLPLERKRKRKGPAKGEAPPVETPIGPVEVLAQAVLPGVDIISSAEEADVEMVGPFVSGADPNVPEVLAPVWVPTLEAAGERVRTDATVLRTGGSGSNTATALCEVARLPGDMAVWRQSTNQEVINNLRRGLMMAVQGSLEIGDRFQRQAAELENSLKMATRSFQLRNETGQDEEGGGGLQGPEEKAAFDRGSVEAQSTMTKQLPGIYNEAFQQGWKALYSWESDDMPQLPPQEVLPYPNAPIGVPEEELPEPQPSADDVAGPSNS
uniref:Uncharacterized protein n=1 Tax=Fagus sylvatica TaxID=28930 RepID=A0A2N9ECV3_FAGSY